MYVNSYAVEEGGKVYVRVTIRDRIVEEGVEPAPPPLVDETRESGDQTPLSKRDDKFDVLAEIGATFPGWDFPGLAAAGRLHEERRKAERAAYEAQCAGMQEQLQAALSEAKKARLEFESSEKALLEAKVEIDEKAQELVRVRNEAATAATERGRAAEERDDYAKQIRELAARIGELEAKHVKAS